MTLVHNIPIRKTGKGKEKNSMNTMFKVIIKKQRQAELCKVENNFHNRRRFT